MMLAGAEIVESSVSFKTDEAGGSQAVISPGTSAEAQAAGAQPPAQAAGLARVPTREPVDIQFSNVTCTVKLGINKGTKQILHGVNGRLRPRKLIAIMGPSGAGKSTLLDVLSGYRTTGVGGAIFINGRGRNMKRFKKMSCYIQQDDRLQGLLTVGENMELAADLKLPTTMDKYEKGEVIEDILTNLGLYEHMHTRGAQLSGGQRKRLSIALELINNPLIMFLDEPTTGLDSSSCTQVVQLCRSLAHQGRTIVCTVHQPSASLFALFDQVYVLAAGNCLYQGTTTNLVPYLEQAGVPCPIYHNPADYVIELACGEYGEDKMSHLTTKAENGRELAWLDEPTTIPSMEALRKQYPLSVMKEQDSESGPEETPQSNQRSVLIRRGFLKAKRDPTMTHLRLIVNVVVGIMLGALFINAGNEGSRVLENYNLLFAILMHHMMSPMMLTILTFPSEMSILLKEHFNRWYSLGSYYISITIVDLPISIVSCAIFSVIVYTMSAQPLDIARFAMFFAISVYTVLVAQSFGLMIGAVFNVVNGTFLGPTLSVPMMMFAGFGVTLRDLPPYLSWGSYVSYLRYGLEGYIGAIYGLERPTLDCNEAKYCHYRYPRTFLKEIAMSPNMFWWDILALTVTLFVLRTAAFLLLKWKLSAVR
ncbi:ATP-binding cassette subfamily G member 4 isoform X1 [Bicyclus anynana]|uniref:ATP-binding cassette subfamily G member 4 isoform X1 n=2 Tax=Bicyclus anynana TaxID=110368 RepID=A0A6J1NBP7_BICAN|nr:ATP-binding cassette subfamily G member 4 isoform X1 [Bicyclus anynana]